MQHYDDASWHLLEGQLKSLEKRASAVKDVAWHLQNRIGAYTMSQTRHGLDQTIALMKKENIHIVWSPDMDKVRALIEALERRIETVETELRELRQGNLAHLLRELEREEESHDGRAE